jgi:hypothetical protein
MQNRIALAAAMLAVLGTASAATINFDLGSLSGSSGSTGNVRSFTNGGVTVTVTSFSLWQGSSTALFTPAATGQWEMGLGVLNSHDDSYPAHQHAVDNADAYTDFILFQFSAAVDPTILKVYQFGGDSDLDYWTGNIPASLAGLQLGALSGFNAGSSNANAANGYRYADLASPGTVNALLVAADLSGCNDFFKITGFSVDYNPPPPPEGVPEPSTYATMGGALLGLGLFAARRKRQAK